MSLQVSYDCPLFPSNDFPISQLYKCSSQAVDLMSGKALAAGDCLENMSKTRG